MKKDWFEDKLNERFDDYDSGLDLNHAWSDLESRRNSKKKKRRPFFFCFVGGMVGVLIVGLFLFSQFFEPKNKSISTQNSKKFLGEIKVETGSKLEDLKLLPQEEKIKETKIDQQKLPAGVAVEFMSKSDSSDPLLTSRNNEIVRGNNGDEISRRDRIIVRDNRISSSTVDVKLNNFLNQDLSETNFGPNSVESAGELLLLPILDLLPAFNQSGFRLEPMHVEKLDHQRFVLEFKTKEETNSSDLTDVKNGIGVSIAYGVHQRQLESQTTGLDDFLASKNNQEKPLDVIDVHAFYRRHLKSGLVAEFGLGLQQTTYKFQREETIISTKEIENGVVAIHSYPDGNTETIYGDVLEIVTTTRAHTHYQKYQQVNLRGLIGKQFGFFGSLDLGVFAGVEYGVYSNAKGVSILSAGTVDRVGKLNDLAYKKSGNLSALLRMDLLADCGPLTDLGFSILGKTSLNSLHQQSEFSDRRNYLMGQLSLVRNF